MDKPKVGDKFCLVHEGINVRSNNVSPCKCVVIKSGRKYFRVKPENRDMEIEFLISTMRQNTIYSSDWSIYNSEDEYRKKIELGKLKRKFTGIFNGYRTHEYTIEQYKKAAVIFGIDITS